MTGSLLAQIGLGVVMLGATMFLHAAGLTGMLLLIRANYSRLRWRRSWYVQASTMLVILLGLVALHFTEIAAYALVYMAIGAVDGLEPALYFSAASYSTAGIGSLVVDDEWRLLGVIEALNGFLLIGWSTALFVSVMLRIWADAKPWMADDDDEDSDPG